MANSLGRSFNRRSRFYLDPNVLFECQQTSTKVYGKGCDRSHLVPAIHLDYSESAIKASNTMTNILPQTSTMNRSAWKLTDEIIESCRDNEELLVIGGVIWSITRMMIILSTRMALKRQMLFGR